MAPAIHYPLTSCQEDKVGGKEDKTGALKAEAVELKTITTSHPVSSQNSEEPKRINYAEWMAHPSIQTKTLSDLTIFGTHHSAFQNALVQSICTLWIAPHLSVCQDMNLHEQLEAGVRYFDLRWSVWTYTLRHHDRPRQELRLRHTVWGNKTLESCLRIIHDYSMAHPSEKFFIAAARDGASKGPHEATLFRECVFRVFNESDIMTHHDVTEVPLGSLTASGKRVAFLRHENYLDPVYNISFRDSWYQIHSANVDELVSNFKEWAKSNCESARSAHELTRLAASINIEVGLSVIYTIQWSLRYYARRVNPRIKQLLESKEFHANIIDADFVTREYVESIVNLNFRDL
ncbi:hypothetical protein HDU79_003755 [Rhizoclosmatium sp. JEL0117]|nr:hypothetical protein HDU79_003755 [Rhizoclosmatium sp. JEL0117]